VRQLLRRASDAGSIILSNRRCAVKHCSYVISVYGESGQGICSVSGNGTLRTFQPGDTLTMGQVKEFSERYEIYTSNYCYEYINRSGGT
jgi:hypothetical protein